MHFSSSNWLALAGPVRYSGSAIWYDENTILLRLLLLEESVSADIHSSRVIMEVIPRLLPSVNRGVMQFHYFK